MRSLHYRNLPGLTVYLLVFIVFIGSSLGRSLPKNERYSLSQLVDQWKITDWARLVDMWIKDGRRLGTENQVDVTASRSGLSRRVSLVHSNIKRLLGFPSKSAYFAFWKKLFVFDLVANVARVGGSLFLYLFAPQLYQLLPGGLVG